MIRRGPQRNLWSLAEKGVVATTTVLSSRKPPCQMVFWCSNSGYIIEQCGEFYLCLWYSGATLIIWSLNCGITAWP